jgi:hypothetical protein
MSAMSDLMIDIAECIERGMSDYDISNALHIEPEWVAQVREEYEEVA